MIAMKNKNLTETMVESGWCIGVHELIDWQIIQYRRAVDTHRIDLSKAEGRCVAWQEAEKDFSRGDRDTLGEKCRGEYCGLLCPSRGKCLIALRHQNSAGTEPLYRAG